VAGSISGSIRRAPPERSIGGLPRTRSRGAREHPVEVFTALARRRRSSHGSTRWPTRQEHDMAPASSPFTRAALSHRITLPNQHSLRLEKANQDSHTRFVHQTSTIDIRSRTTNPALMRKNRGQRRRTKVCDAKALRSSRSGGGRGEIRPRRYPSIPKRDVISTLSTMFVKRIVSTP
jgi:hypothetical protein